MTHKASANLLRLGYNRLWPNKWCNDINYSDILIEDFRLRFLIKNFFYMKNISILEVKISRLPGETFLVITGVISWIKYNFQETNLKEITDQLEFFQSLPELKAQMYSSFGRARVTIMLRLFHFGYRKHLKYRKFQLLRSASALSERFAEYLKKKTKKPHRHILGVFRSLFKKKNLNSLKIYGIKIRIAGPLFSPRNKKKKKITKVVGDMPLNSFSSLIEYHHATGISKSGSFGIKVWVNRGRKSLLVSGNQNKRPNFSRLAKKSFYSVATKSVVKGKRVYIYRYIRE